MVTIDMSKRVEVQSPSRAGVWIVRSLTFREFIDFALKSNSVEDSVSNLEQMMEVCTLAVVGYRVDGKEHSVNAEILDAAGVADVGACFKAVMAMSKVEADTAGK